MNMAKYNNSYRETQALQVVGFEKGIEGLSEVFDTCSVGSPWAKELGEILINLTQKLEVVKSDLYNFGKRGD